MSELVLRVARVVDSNLEDSYNPLITVRILPDQQDAKESDCAVFSPFFSNKCGKFTSERQDGISKAEMVWVATSKDYSEGYVLGRAGRRASNSQKDASSFGEIFDFNHFKNLLSELQSQGVSFDGFTVKKIEIDLISSSDGKKGSIICHNIETGDIFIFTSAGGVLALTPQCFAVKVGDSKFTMTNNAFTFHGNSFQVQCPKVSLGQQGLKVLGTSETIGDAVLGSQLIPSSVISM